MIPRALIVDDEADWQEMFREVFTSAGWEADSAGDMNAAKELLKASTYKLIILDIFLSPTQAPLSYQSSLVFLARTYPDVVVVAVTGKQLAPDEAFALSRLGVSDFIYKPRIQLDDMRRIAHTIAEPDQMRTTLIEKLDRRLERIEVLLEDGLDALSASVAQVRGLTRALIKLVSADVDDCPRLFTLAEVPDGRISRTARVKYTLTLWCEYPGAEHSWDAATYRFSRPKDWLQKLVPYGLLVSRILSIVIPVAASIPGVVLSVNDFQRVQYQLELMKEVAGQLPQTDAPASTTSSAVDQLTVEEGAGLRALRTLLLAEDKNRIFGDLRKVGTESGEIVWVCPRHEKMLLIP
jgi:CheY-like chemotaxis protein